MFAVAQLRAQQLKELAPLAHNVKRIATRGQFSVEAHTGAGLVLALVHVDKLTEVFDLMDYINVHSKTLGLASSLR